MSRTHYRDLQPHGAPTAVTAMRPGRVGYAAALLLLAKPGIVAAVLLSGFTGMVLAERRWPDAGSALACMASLFLAATGSAMLNNVLDFPLDVQMERLRTRVVALERAGRKRVLATAVVAIIAALAMALRYLNLLAFVLTLTAVLSYTLLYTLRLKRHSPWGAVPGGVPGALPVLIGYAATGHPIGFGGIILFSVMLLWQPPHFWALALSHRHDYAAAGLPVLPVVYGERYTKLLVFIYATALIPASLSLRLFGYCTVWYAGAALVGGGAFLTTCCFTMVRNDRPATAFSASVLYLLFLLAAILCDICFLHR